MKGRFRLGLEKLLNAGKRIGKFIKENAKTEIMVLGLGFGSYFIDKFMPNAHAETSDGIIEIRNWTNDSSPSRQSVLMRDNYHDTRYLEPPSNPALISYIYDPNSSSGPYLKGKGINPLNTNEIKIWCESRGVPTDIDHFLKINIFSMYGSPADMNDYTTRNLTLHQEPNNLDADPNLYDIKELTNYGTKYGYIPFRTFDPAQWIFRSDNYADLNFSGKVDLEDCAIWADSWLRNDCNSNNHWCNFADLDRDENVDFYDLARMADEYGYDTNDPNTYSKLTPKVNGASVLGGRHLREFQESSRRLFCGRKEPLYARKEKEAA